MSSHPFRFGVQFSSFPKADWRSDLHRLEELGYSSLFFPDHFSPQWEPVAALGAAAGATRKLKVGTLVFDVDYRHPVVLAKGAATLQLVSGNRHEFGIGAGWMKSDYDQAGLAFDPPGVRIERLDEALQICRSMWTQDATSFEGRHYTVEDVPRASSVPEGVAFEPPKVLVGGGGPRILRLAGRTADIVGINPKCDEGRVTADTPADQAPERVRQKIGWIREGAEKAGRDFDAIELNSLSFLVAITDDPKPLREALAGNSPMTVDEIADCPLFLTGPPNEIRDRLEERRRQFGISYIVIQGGDSDRLEQFAEHVVAPLAGR